MGTGRGKPGQDGLPELKQSISLKVFSTSSSLINII